MVHEQYLSLSLFFTFCVLSSTNFYCLELLSFFSEASSFILMFALHLKMNSTEKLRV